MAKKTAAKKPKTLTWPSGKKVAEFDHGLLAQDTKFPYVIQCEQFKTSHILMDRLKALPNVEVRFSNEVVSVSQTADNVEVVVRSPAGEERHVARLFDLAKGDVAGYDSYAARVTSLYADEPEALEIALRDLQPGDVVAMMCIETGPESRARLEALGGRQKVTT